MFAVAFAHFFGLTGNIKCTSGGGVGKQIKGLLLLARVVGNGGVNVGGTAGIVDGLKEHLALGEPLAVHAISQR